MKKKNKIKNEINNNFFNTIKIFIVLAIIIGIINFTIIYIREKIYIKTVNTAILNIVESVREKYPEVDETKIISTLKNENNKMDENALKKYGYESERIYLEQLKQEFKHSTIIYIVAEAFGTSIILVAFILYIKKENKKVEAINEYLNKVNNGNYELEILENSNDELSKLRNEIYKTTILLRETAETNKKESKSLSDSLADISHQLKTPLTSMRIMLDNIEDNPGMDEDTKNDFLHSISNQVDWMSSLVISLLKLSRFDAGMIIMNNESINLKKIINDVIKKLSIMAEVKDITIILNIDDKIEYNADYKWQIEAFTNIIKNAIEHSKENSKIIIQAEQSSIFTKIIIQDEGEGISNKDIKHIFERFYKAKNSSENSIGIGLALSKSIIEKENGLISVKSEEGKGTKFIIKYLR